MISKDMKRQVHQKLDTRLAAIPSNTTDPPAHFFAMASECTEEKGKGYERNIVHWLTDTLQQKLIANDYCNANSTTPRTPSTHHTQ
ncbi:hypothetical protein Hypma_003349 [Hypsizygus marmoreus]|uniref:Uncharacterized protein n=1 Tax=Hypsizygus marmoreus TaxID=39966 RepID=A0A369J2B7_HYPMA|nr:hypothetical protein Hypma_003349 [Hypsizygus marmoreus]